MAKTCVSDIVKVSNFTRYVIQRSVARTALIGCGVIQRTPQFDELAGRPGKTVQMPYWKPLSASRQVLSDAAELVVNRITADYDLAAIQYDANSWSVNDLAGWLSGEDPIEAIVSLLGDYWAEENQKILLASLKGIFGSTGMAGNKLAIASESIAATTDANRLTGTTFVDATKVMGDRAALLRTLVIHSAVEAFLRKRELLTTLRDSEGREVLTLFQGRRVVIDDSMPVRDGTTDGKVYTSYLLGNGVFAHGNAPLDEPAEGGTGTKGAEVTRQALAGDTVLINRRCFILHPRGIRWIGDPGLEMKNDTLALGDNWERVWELKNIPIVMIEHNI